MVYLQVGGIYDFFLGGPSERAIESKMTCEQVGAANRQ